MQESYDRRGHSLFPLSMARQLAVSVLQAIALSCLFSLSVMAAPQTQYRFEHLIDDTGINVGATNAIFQDSNGFIWLGGDNGAARFDGHSYTIFQPDPGNPNSINHNYVWDIAEDASGNIWFGTSNGLSRYDPVSQQFKNFVHTEASNSLAQNVIRRLYIDSHNNLWVATEKGLDRYEEESESFVHFDHDPEQAHSISDNFIYAIYEDSRGFLWVGTKYGGLNRYDYASNSFMHFNHPSPKAGNISKSAVNDIIEDQSGYLWIATDIGLYRLHLKSYELAHFKPEENNKHSLSSERIDRLLVDQNNQLWAMTNNAGLNVYHRKKNNFTRYQHNPYDNESIQSNQLKAIYQDKAGDIWLGLFPVGVDFINSSSSEFTVYRNNPDDLNSLGNNAINILYPAMDGKIWIGSEGGVDLFDPNNNSFEHFVHDPNNPQSLAANAVLSITQDIQGDYWFGTWSGGLHRFDAKNKNFERFLPKSDDKNSLSTIYVWSLLGDSKGNLWIGSQSEALDRYNLNTKELTHFYPNIDDPKALSGIYIRQIYEDKQGTIWIATLQGLNRFNPEDESFTRFDHIEGDETSIANNGVAAILEDSRGIMWIGTDAGFSRMDKASGTFKNYFKKDGLESEAISGISEDLNGDLWLNTKKGLVRFNVEKELFQTYTKFHGLAGHVMPRPAAYMSKDGDFYVGSTQGITHFRPERIIDNSYHPPVFITGFSIFNEAVRTSAKDGLLTQDIRWTDTITLNYTQSMISLDFAALNFRNSDKNLYRYRMSGFDEKWIEAGSKNSATYTNLNPGSYTFTVKGANNDGVWNPNGKSITLIQLPPPWLTWWAYCIYGAFICLLIYIFVRSQQRKVREAIEKMRMERELVKRLESLDKLKDDFLANTSHELRTPLNGIIGLADSILQGSAGELSEKLQSNLNMISMSGKRLAHLVNEILDFSKLKNREIQLYLKPTNLVSTVKIVLAMSEPSTLSKNIRLINTIEDTIPTVLADSNRLQQILYNFIGNAIKFTDKGSVTVSANVVDDKVWVHIKDTGIGIAQDMIEKIFESFEQLESHEQRSQGGTGLGLSVTKRLVELHQGKIRVASKENQGSTFSFCLPVSGEPAEADENELSVSRMLDFSKEDKTRSPISAAPSSTGVSNDLQKENNARFKILIVDDDDINREVLQSQLSEQNYTLVPAAGGEQALKIMESDGPFDLILLDIMMPSKSGYDVCKALRKDYSLQELPIIFITAKNLIQDLADGFELGANDFLTKPISMGELHSRVRTHLQLLDMNRNLERKVVQRTKEVTLANVELKTLDNIVATIHQELRFDRLLEVILREASALFPNADTAAYWKYEKERDEFKLVSINDAKQEKREETSKDPQMETMAYDTMSPEKIREYYLNHEGQPCNAIHTLNREQIEQIRPASRDICNASSALLIPLSLEQEVVAILVLSSLQEEAFDKARETTLDRFRSHVLSALSKAKLLDLLESQCLELENMSVTDTLTGLHNRRFLQKYFPIDINKILQLHHDRLSSEKEDTPAKPQDFVLFILDIDHFKQVNDTYGHVAGDKVISDISNILKGLFRESDYCVRWGGEEFLVVAKYCFRDSAPVMAEKIRVAVEEFDFVIDEKTTLHKSCSIGFACYPFFEDQPEKVHWEQVLDVADNCLYAAKKSQRNAWVGVYSNESEAPEDWDPEMLNNAQENIDQGAWLVKSNITFDKPLIWE